MKRLFSILCLALGLAQMKALLKQSHPVPVTGGQAEPDTRAKFSE